MQSTNIRQRKRGPAGPSLPRHSAGESSPGVGDAESLIGPLVPGGACENRAHRTRAPPGGGSREPPSDVVKPVTQINVTPLERICCEQ
ncbi:MAG TPA: hypothetical protein VKB35_02020 [Ktedonobacteraceae bacterium]|nr:hypothetical protein [Ktedonobacteraceae bacterium]